MPFENTVSVGSFNLILFAAQQKGVDPTRLCGEVGVDPAVLRNPDGRVPIRVIQALWREVIEVTGDPYLSLRIGEMINPVAVGVLAYVMMHCPTLGGAFEKLCHYQAIVCNAILTTGRRQADRYALELQITSPDIIYPEYALNSELVMYLAAMRALTGQTVTATEVRFSYPRPLYVHEHERVFGPARLVFDADDTAMVLDAVWLDAPVLNANPGLFPLFEQHADELLQKLRESPLRESPLRESPLQKSGLSTRVKQEIVALLKGEEPALTIVADQLAMGVRTLQLHLKDEGTTYQQWLDEVRRDLAMKHLREPHLSTTDIAYLLGFSEPSVFFRSFKKWTGVTPGVYRGQQLA